jgi:hypothetical protein
MIFCIISCSSNDFTEEKFDQDDFLIVNEDYQLLAGSSLENLNVSCILGENPYFDFGDEVFIVELTFDDELMIGQILLSPIVQITFVGEKPTDGNFTIKHYNRYNNEGNNSTDFNEGDVAIFVEYFGSNCADEFFADGGSLAVKTINNDVSVAFKDVTFRSWTDDVENVCPITMEGKISCR